jgi:DNA-binding MarR family transcriptional regulator
MKRPNEKEQKREAGPKFKSVLPADFRIRRTESPMARILREAEAPAGVLSPPDNLSPDVRPSSPDILTPGDELSPPDKPSPEAGTVTPSRDEIAPDASLSPPDKLSPDDINPHAWTGVPNDVWSKINCKIKAAEQAVFGLIYRETRGYHRDECLLSKAAIARGCMMSERNVPRITKKLAQRGLIEILRHDYDNPDIRKRGTWYRMLVPGAALRRNLSPPDKLSSGAKMSPHSKEEDKRKSKEGRLAPEQIEAKTAEAAEFLRAGESPETVAARFASINPVDLARVMSIAKVQAQSSKSREEG